MKGKVAMSDRIRDTIPSRPASHWPAGLKLRFAADARLAPGREQLRGRPVLVLSELRLIGPTASGYSWRQQVLVLTTGQIGWARPDQLDLPLDEVPVEAPRP